MTLDQINSIFSYHAPVRDQAQKYETLRADARAYAIRINELCPESREKSLALTKLQEVVMFANAAIAINES